MKDIKIYIIVKLNFNLLPQQVESNWENETHPYNSLYRISYDNMGAASGYCCMQWLY